MIPLDVTHTHMRSLSCSHVEGLLKRGHCTDRDVSGQKEREESSSPVLTHHWLSPSVSVLVLSQSLQLFLPRAQGR